MKYTKNLHPQKHNHTKTTISLPTTARQHSPPSPRPTVTARHPHMVPRYTWGARAIRRLHAVDRHLSFGRPSPGARGLGLGSRDLGFSEKRPLHACALACQGAVRGAPRLALHSRAHQAMCPREHSLPHRPLPSPAPITRSRAPRFPLPSHPCPTPPARQADGGERATAAGLRTAHAHNALNGSRHSAHRQRCRAKGLLLFCGPAR